MNSRLKFTQKGPEAGDCTVPYKVDIDEECRDLTVFLRTVLEERSDEWGYIYLMEAGQSWLDAPRIEYRNGELVSTPRDTSFKNRTIECVTASGGWSRMDYYVRFKASEEGTKEPAKDEAEQRTKEEIVFYAWIDVQAKRWPEEEGEYIVTVALDGRDERFVKLCGFVKDFRAAYGFGDAGPEWVFDRLPTGYPVFVESEFVHVVAWMPWPKAYRERS